MVGFTPTKDQFPTTTSESFIWNNITIKFHYVGSYEISKSLLKKITKQTMEIGKNSCDSTNFTPTTLTINGDPNNLLSTIEYLTSKKCSPTSGLQTKIIFDNDGNMTNSFITFN